MQRAGWIAASLGFIGLLLPGCATVPPAAELAATTSSFAYSAGRGSQAFYNPPAQVLGALGEALADLNLSDPRASKDGTVSRVEARTNDQRRVLATLRAHQGATQVAIRVGWFGDEPLSRSLLERVGVRLGSRAPEAIPEVAPSTPSGNPFFARDAIPDSVMLRDFAEAPFRDRVIP